jgi:hypothetical protein
MPRTTKLICLISGNTICEWIDATSANHFDDARLEVAEVWNCRLGEIGYDEDTHAGEAFTVNDKPVAILEWHYVPHPSMSRSVVDLRPLMQAAE